MDAIGLLTLLELETLEWSQPRGYLPWCSLYEYAGFGGRGEATGWYSQDDANRLRQ
jgi:hypothetical protein